MFKFHPSLLIFALLVAGALALLPFSPARAEDAQVCSMPSSSHSSDSDPDDPDHHHSSHHKKTLPATGIPTGLVIGGLIAAMAGTTLVRKGFVSFRKRSLY